ncbi:MAG: hypothetical protein AAGF12_42925 [Myxococcota bacterium]
MAQSWLLQFVRDRTSHCRAGAGLVDRPEHMREVHIGFDRWKSSNPNAIEVRVACENGTPDRVRINV